MSSIESKRLRALSGLGSVSQVVVQSISRELGKSDLERDAMNLLSALRQLQSTADGEVILDRIACAILNKHIEHSCWKITLGDKGYVRCEFVQDAGIRDLLAECLLD